MPFPSEDALDQPLSISELARGIDRTLRQSVGEVYFEGEVSQITRAQSGHVYLSLKDEESQIACVIWRRLARSIDFDLRQGMTLLCRGMPNVYHGNGRFQMILSSLSPSGEGALRQKFLLLKAKLEAEGLFDEARKRPIPFLPRTVGIITSASGAAIHDIMVKIHERFPSTQAVLIDTRVQGLGAAEEIATAIALANARQLADVLIVGRGGGSLEDLWAFNEEVVVRAIFASRIPIISAVGHERDLSLSDLVADRRAPTPTAAGEQVVPNRAELQRILDVAQARLLDIERVVSPRLQRLDEVLGRLQVRLTSYYKHRRLELASLERGLGTIRPVELLRRYALSCRELASRLAGGSIRAVKRKQERLHILHRRLEFSSPQRSIDIGRQVLLERAMHLQRSYSSTLHVQGIRLRTLNDRLSASRPDKILQRGFAMVRRGKDIIARAHDIKNRPFEVVFADGSIEAMPSEICTQRGKKDGAKKRT